MDLANELPNPKRLKTLASGVAYAGGNNLLHQFVLDNSPPNRSQCSEGDLNAHLLTISSSSLDVNALNGEGYSPLHLAVLKNNLLMVQKLLSCLANIRVDTECGIFIGQNTALHLAAGLGYLEIIQALLNQGADIDAANGRGTALYAAAKSGHLDIIKLLVGKGANVNSDRFFYPLHCAVFSGNLECVKFLVSSGADLSAGDILDDTILHIAARSDNLAIMEFLGDLSAYLPTKSSSPLDVNALNGEGYSPLHLAVLKKNILMVKMLLSCFANIDVDTKCSICEGENTVLHFAANIDVDTKRSIRKGENTALHLAAELGCSEIIQALLNQGAAIDAANSYRETALCVAAKSGHLDIIKLLVRKGAHVNLGIRFESPLFCAIQSGNLKCVIFLVKKGADVNREDACGLTPLFYAAQSGHLHAIKFLLDKGANLNFKSESGHQLFLWAIGSGDLDTMGFFLDNGADPNIEDEFGHTPLREAVKSSKLAAVEFLIRKGANVTAIKPRFIMQWVSKT